MYIHHASFFVDPYSKTKLNLTTFLSDGECVKDGVFLNPISNTIYPIVDGVPIFIQNRIPRYFEEQYRNDISALGIERSVIDSQISHKNIDFSFSNEWKAAHNDNVKTVWGYSAEEWLQIHYADTEISENELQGKLLLDVGCGNGILCKSIAEKGAVVFGIDYSTSVWNAQKEMSHPRVCFLQADLHFLPFLKESFDTVYSNGVLHHTSNTENAFKIVSQMVKPAGKYYVWLYTRSTSTGFNIYLYVTDAMRFVTNKLPVFFQKAIIESLLFLKIQYCKLRGKAFETGNLRTDLYDTLTPKYKYYHTLPEVQSWFLENGYHDPRQTHTNVYGIGILGNKNR
jgi:SAM-dependent methyltransferase